MLAQPRTFGRPARHSAPDHGALQPSLQLDRRIRLARANRQQDPTPTPHLLRDPRALRTQRPDGDPSHCQGRRGVPAAQIDPLPLPSARSGALRLANHVLEGPRSCEPADTERSLGRPLPLWRVPEGPQGSYPWAGGPDAVRQRVLRHPPQRLLPVSSGTPSASTWASSTSPPTRTARPSAVSRSRRSAASPPIGAGTFSGRERRLPQAPSDPRSSILYAAERQPLHRQACRCQGERHLEKDRSGGPPRHLQAGNGWRPGAGAPRELQLWSASHLHRVQGPGGGGFGRPGGSSHYLSHLLRVRDGRQGQPPLPGRVPMCLVWVGCAWRPQPGAGHPCQGRRHAAGGLGLRERPRGATDWLSGFPAQGLPHGPKDQWVPGWSGKRLPAWHSPWCSVADPSRLGGGPRSATAARPGKADRAAEANPALHPGGWGAAALRPCRWLVRAAADDLRRRDWQLDRAGRRPRGAFPGRRQPRPGGPPTTRSHRSQPPPPPASQLRARRSPLPGRRHRPDRANRRLHDILTRPATGRARTTPPTATSPTCPANALPLHSHLLVE